MSKEEIKQRISPICQTIYKWLHNFKEIIAVIICLYGCYTWVSGQFNDVKREIATVRATEHYVDTDKTEHAELYAQCKKSDARFDSIEWNIACLIGGDSILTDEIIAVKNRVFNLENK